MVYEHPPPSWRKYVFFFFSQSIVINFQEKSLSKTQTQSKTQDTQAILPWAESKNYQKCKEMAMEFNGTGFAQHAQGPGFSEKSINK